jgi:hypothetical protein
LRKNSFDFATRKHDRQSVRPLRTLNIIDPRQLDLQHLSIHEQHRVQRLVLRRSGNLPANREVAQERR